MSHRWRKTRRGRRVSGRQAVGFGEQQGRRSDGGEEAGEGRVVPAEDQGKRVEVWKDEMQGDLKNEVEVDWADYGVADLVHEALLGRGDGEAVGWEDEEVDLGDEEVKGQVGW